MNQPDLFATVPKDKTTTPLSPYDRTYNNLNAQQKLAVDTIHGPVLVNAGPGTGKTQILATRIGKILLDTDMSPHNILCLTYTDAATIAMRRRLVKIIGATAHKIHIYSFHGFCNNIIQENMELFGDYRSLEPISDLERIDVYRALFDGLEEGNPLKKYKGNKYHYITHMQNLFSLMKKENYTTQDIHDAVDKHLEELKETLVYKTTTKHGKKGELKTKDYNKKASSFSRTKAAASLFPIYKKLMLDEERYDFEDMILWVLEKFKTDDTLLLEYQERYQYVLVDEYQDTNGSQNEILSQIISYWDKPNVFVVGDDDQAIFKFQGANIGNIKEFKNTYLPLPISLVQNYRSSSPILDSANQLISNNKERISLEDKNLQKKLIASGKYKNNKRKPVVRIYNKQSEEIAHIAKQLIDAYQKDPSELKNIAVLYRQHKQIQDLVTVLNKKNIPLNIKRKKNILKEPIIHQLRNILSYIQEEYQDYGSGQSRLFKILHYNYFGINPIDIGKIAIALKYNPKKENNQDWRNLLIDEQELSKLNLHTPEKITEVSNLLDTWIGSVGQMTLQVFVEKIMNEGGILDFLIGGNNRAWDLQVITTFFELIKTESVKKSDLDLGDLLGMLDKYDENRLSLDINKIISSEDGINFMTAHGAKGLEFKKIFILDSTKKVWDRSRSNNTNFAYPKLINGDIENNQEDERRLFYVAMTRAETDLIISYSKSSIEDKALQESMFVTEILKGDHVIKEECKVQDNITLEFYHNLIKGDQKTIPLIDKNLIDRWLEGYKLSVTHLNKFLHCPISFYFEAILQIPQARVDSSGFGSAIHDALQKHMEHRKKERNAAVEHLLTSFENSLAYYKSHFTDRQFVDYLAYGKIILNQYYEKNNIAWSKLDKFELEAKIDKSEYKGIPIKGFLDKVEIYKDQVKVVDYKTGKYKSEKLKSPSDKDPNGGDYWRQLVFYKLLLESDTQHNWNMAAGQIDFIEPHFESLKSELVEINPDDMHTVGEQIVETMENIKQYKFDTTCTHTYCKWCDFVRNNFNGKLM